MVLLLNNNDAARTFQLYFVTKRVETCKYAVSGVATHLLQLSISNKFECQAGLNLAKRHHCLSICFKLINQPTDEPIRGDGCQQTGLEKELHSVTAVVPPKDSILQLLATLPTPKGILTLLTPWAVVSAGS